jgi:hypothetical protein
MINLYSPYFSTQREESLGEREIRKEVAKAV